MNMRNFSGRRAGFLSAALFAVTFIATTAGLLFAGNQWSCLHWGKNTLTRSVGPQANAYWSGIIASEFDQWDAGTCIDFTSVPTGGEINGDANFYGINGWLGLAQVWYDPSTCEILHGEALMNRSYLDGASYDQTDDEHVACQEEGHDLGLNHRKGPRARTCMNDMFLGFPDFDNHDAGVIADITVGCDSVEPEPGLEKEKGRKKCNDGKDNDGDGLIDAADPDCQ
jgi:hypothetical protein